MGLASGVHDYHCLCDSWHSGRHCEQSMADACEAYEVHCYNGGKCESFGDYTGSYMCHCESGFTGEYCEHTSEEICASNICKNGGTCVTEVVGLKYKFFGGETEKKKKKKKKK